MGNNCLECEWYKRPASVRREVCFACSKKFTSKSSVRNGINELSNGGQTIISYDNHNPEMDDRDVVSQTDKDYLHSLSSHAPVIGQSLSPEEMVEMIKKFLCDMSMLPDMHILLFMSRLRGEKQTTFAKNHRIPDAAANTIYNQLLNRSEVFRSFMTMMLGPGLKDSRGRKPKNSAKPRTISKKTNLRYSCTEQMEICM